MVCRMDVRWLLFFGVCVRVAFAYTNMDMVWPDEHHQTLEPANALVNGYWQSTWEWRYGTRSWLVPLFFTPPLLVLKLFGITGGMSLVIACRVWMGLLSVLFLWSFHQLLLFLRFSKSVALWTLATVCFFPPFIGWSVTTLSENLALLFWWVPLPKALSLISNKNKKSWLISGLLSGLPILARLQMAPLVVGPVMAIFSQKKTSRNSKLLFFFIGYGLVWLYSGLWDWMTWGKPFYSFYQNFYWNIIKGVAGTNGIYPWYSYLPLVWEDLGIWSLFLAGGFFCVKAFEQSTAHRKLFASWVLFASFLFLVLHSVLAHKETRFLFPIYPILFIAIALVLEKVEKQKGSLRIYFKKWILVPCLILLAMISWKGAYSTQRFPFHDTSAIIEQFMTYIKSSQNPNSSFCVSFFDLPWTTVRGSIVFGQKVEIQSVYAKDLEEPDFDFTCPFVLLPQHDRMFFDQVTHQQWKPIAETTEHLAVERKLTALPTRRFSSSL